jgi:hypothetical protein
MNKKKQIELITEAHNAGWEHRESTNYPNEKQKGLNNFLKSKGLGQKELGHVYKDDTIPLWMMMFSEDGIMYGFDMNGNWFKYKDTPKNQLKFLNNGTPNVLATPEEWEARLKEEALRLGFIKGAKFRSALDGSEAEVVTGEFFNNDNPNYLCANGESHVGSRVMHNGIWATIIEPKQEPTESDPDTEQSIEDRVLFVFSEVKELFETLTKK